MSLIRKVKTSITLERLLLINLIIFGLVSAMNSMTRFDSQIFSCSFWLLCSETNSNEIYLNQLLQITISFLGLTSLIIKFASMGRKAFSRNSIKLFTFTISLIVIYVSVSLYALVNNLVYPIIQTFLSIIISMILLINFLKLKNKNIEVTNPIKKNNKIVYLLVSSFLMIVFGYIVSITGASKTCSQFPICFSIAGITFESILVNTHRIFTLLTGILLISSMFSTWKKYRENQDYLVSTTVAFVIFLGQSIIGGIQVNQNLPSNLLFIHSISSIAYILSITYSTYASNYLENSEKTDFNTFFNDAQRRKDFLILNKPIIVVLLLVTTYAGMVVGGKEIPSLSLTIWTLLGGALAAGGSSAINQFIDREIDQEMQRTAKRPIPSGRLFPAEGLALGISEVILSFFIYVIFVNLNAAILAMAGMVYYVFIYSKWLKHITVQNIVIGGGAGAIPPLVGWAAVTGGLNVPSLFLFALVFLWTPPHFWALALVRKKDYARASIPMLPVIKGEKNTRLQILIYTIQLVILTLLMPLFGVGGSVYLVLAIILGLWILRAAWLVYKKQGNKIAYKMYRYSSMYLAFIFFALVIDVLI